MCSFTCRQSVIGNILILGCGHLAWHSRLEAHHIWVLWSTKPYKKFTQNRKIYVLYTVSM